MNKRIKKKLAKRHNIKSFKIYDVILTIQERCRNISFEYKTIPDATVLRMYQCFFSELIPEDSIYISNMESYDTVSASGSSYIDITTLKMLAMDRSEILNDILPWYSDDEPDWHFAVINPKLATKFGFDQNYDTIYVYYKENGGN